VQAKKELVADIRNDPGVEVASDQKAMQPPKPAEEPVQTNPVAVSRASGDEDERVAKLEIALSELRVTLAERERVLEERVNRISELENIVKQLRQELVWARSEQDDIPVMESIVSASDQAGIAGEIGSRTYAVRANDSLSAIAKRVYGDATKWRLIQDANREILGDSEVLRIGQVLEIPELEERSE
jgi:nucleoid-associated protein YgaU